MDAEAKWQKAKDILCNNSSEEQQKEAVCLLNEAISSNHTGAYYTLAQVYYYGISVEQDLNKAYELYNKAISLGFNKVNLLMAQMCIDGFVVEKNISKAEEILISLAKEDVPDACAMLGWLAFDRSEANLTNEEVWPWINKGASLGNVDCKLYLARRLRIEGKEKDFFNIVKNLSLDGNHQAYYEYAEALYWGLGCEKDAKEAVHWFDLACKDGDARAMCYLGNRYLDGIGVDSFDIDKAIELMTQSAELGFPLAMKNLGAIYGQLCEDEKASYWFDKAAEAGEEDALSLKEQYSDSTFVNRLNYMIRQFSNSGYPQKALTMVENLYSKGDGRVFSTMLNIYLNGIGENSFGKDEAKAFLILSNKAKDGDSYALFMLAQFYEKGIVVDQNIDKAFEYYMIAANAGYPYAQYVVGCFYNQGISIKCDKKEAAT